MRAPSLMSAPSAPVYLGIILTCCLWPLAAGAAGETSNAAGGGATRYGIGSPATAQQIAGWNIDISRDGKGLPPGSGTVVQGHKLYDAQCAACHGATGEGGIGDRLAGGQGSLASAKPIRTVGSYWPYATTLFDYIRRAMPLTAPQSLTNDEVYAVTGYVLAMNGLAKEQDTMDAKSLMAVKMPNRDGFVGDPRPDVPQTACMKDC